MPRVPEYGSFQVMPEVLSGQTVTGIDPKVGALGGAVAQQSIKLAQQAQNRMNSVAVDFANEANQLRVKEVMNQLRAEEQRLTFDSQEGYTTIMGGNALNRGDKGSLDQEYGQRLKTYGDKLRGALGNDAQRKLFDESAGTVYTNFGTGIQKHLLKQYYVYGDSVRQAEADRIAQGMMLTDDPEVIAQGVNDLVNIAHEHSQVYGTEVDVPKLTSPVLRRVIDTKISNGYLGTAKRMTDAFKDYLSAEDMGTLKKAWQEENEIAQANNAAMKAFEIAKSKGGYAEATKYLAKQPFNIKNNANAFFQGMVNHEKLVQEEKDRNGRAQVITLIEAGYNVSRSTMRGLGLSESAQKDMVEFNLNHHAGKETVNDTLLYMELMDGVQSGAITDYAYVRAKYNNLDKEHRTKLENEFNSAQQARLSGNGRGLPSIKKQVADEAVKVYMRLNPGKSIKPEEMVQIRESAFIAVSDYHSNTGKLPEDPTSMAYSLFSKDKNSGFWSSNVQWETMAEGKKDSFSPKAKDLMIYRDRYTQSNSRWATQEMGDDTLTVAVATDPNNNFVNRDRNTKLLIEKVMGKYGVDRQQAREVIHSLIVNRGLSYADILSRVYSPKGAQERADSIRQQIDSLQRQDNFEE